jgi:spore coat protein CotF
VLILNLNITQKERMLLEDQKKHEQVCIQKYQSYAAQAQNPQLQQLFQTHSSDEQQHLNTINQLLSGQIPNQSQQNSAQQQMNPQQQINQQQGQGNQVDAYLCNDLLSTEKYVSSTYDTTIFQFTNPQARQVLNHIQKEEQKHGEDILLYMLNHGMYNPQ